MSVNPYPPLPRDKGQEAMQEYPSPKKALARYASENSSSSSVISVSHDTTAIEIAAVGGPAVMRWVPTTETAGVAPAGSIISAFTGSNFDHVISSGEIRRFAIPIESMYQAPSSMVGANRANGLYQRVAIKAVGVSSVLVTEY